MGGDRSARPARRVLVVGAIGRLGVAIAEAHADRGDEVVLTARDPSKLEELAASITRRAWAADGCRSSAPT